MCTTLRVLFFLAAAGTIIMVSLGRAGDARAHAALVGSDPAAGATLEDAPREIRLWFTEPLEMRYTRAEVLDAAGEPVPGATSAIAPEDNHQLIVSLPPDLPDGGYTVAWRTLSAADGHTLQGYFGFSVGTATAGSAVPLETSSSALESL